LQQALALTVGPAADRIVRMKSARPIVEYTPSGLLSYDRSRTMPGAGEALRMDAAYRLAHLPLVNPAHPDVIVSQPGKSYEMGVHQRIHSLVLPIPAAELAASSAFGELDRAIRRSLFARKIAWDIMDRRADHLHATIAGSMAEGDAAPLLPPGLLADISALGPFRIRIQGLFSGNINTGRLYLKVYPEWRNGGNAIHALQKLLGRAVSDLYLVGLYNLIDHLNAKETDALAAIINDWWAKPLLDIDLTELWLLSSCDDLVLDSRIEQRISLFSL
jgi:hypothetical protein